MSKFYITFFCGLTILLSALGCTSKQDSTSKRTEPLEKLDPTSAVLYQAQKQAKASDFQMIRVNGESFTLSNHSGQVVLLNIWATWCPPCHDETPDFVDLYSKYKDEGLLVLGVSVDKQGKSVVKPFMEKYNVNYPMVVDDGTIMDKYGPTMGMPTTYIIGRGGNLEYFAVGALTKKELEPRLQKLLAEDSSLSN